MPYLSHLCTILTTISFSSEWVSRERPSASIPMVSFRHNLRNLTPTRFSSVDAAALPTSNTFSSLEVNDATESLCSTLSLSLDSQCPLSTKPAQSSQSHPWLNDTLRALRTNLRAAERKWHKSKDPADVAKLQALLSSFASSVTDAKKSFYINIVLLTPGNFFPPSKLYLILRHLLPILRQTSSLLFLLTKWQL